MATNYIIEKVTDSNGGADRIASTFYGTCSTAAGTAQKAVTISDSCTFNDNYLITGVTVHVKFTYSNTNATPTLKVGSATAKQIMKYGTTKPGTTTDTSWYAGSVVSFTYDGTYWQMNDHIDNTNTQTVSGVKGSAESSYRTGDVNLTAANIGALASDTKYAGASTAGGSATSAAKLDTSTAGSATQPCYFSSGVPSGCTYSLNKTVPSDAVFTDTLPSAYCDTAAATAAKTASCTDYTLTTKTWIQVLIKTANSKAGALTLSINGKTAKPIYINGTASSSSNYTLPAGTYFVYYDGTAYQFRTDGKLPGSITGDAGTVGGKVVTDTYSGTSTDAMSGKAVKSAIDALDGTVSGSAGASKTLTAFSQTDGKVSATFGNISITKSQISDFPIIPTATSELTNDAGFITDSIVGGYGAKSFDIKVGDTSDPEVISTAISGLTLSAGYPSAGYPSYFMISGEADLTNGWSGNLIRCQCNGIDDVAWSGYLIDISKYQVGDDFNLNGVYVSGLVWSRKYFEGTIFLPKPADGYGVTGCSFTMGNKVTLYGASGQLYTGTTPGTLTLTLRKAAGIILFKYELTTQVDTANNNRPATLWFDSGCKITFT